MDHVRDWWQGLSRRRRRLVAAVAASVCALVVVVGVQATGSAGSAAGPPPVLLVPGYGGSRAALSRLADSLRHAGREARVVTLPGDGTGDLRAQTRALDAAAAGDPVDVIGYSAGGVVTRLWVNGGGSARRVVTLGSPLHGTEIAAAGGVLAPDACPVACQQLSPGSALLVSADREPVAVPWMSIWTENDQTVVPPESARLAGAVNVSLQSLCPSAVVAHSALPTDPLVTRVVLGALSGDTMAAPAAGCVSS
ncbi:lipase family alpha/beta hydrolase [Actinophytocola sp.]|uniref:lipase family alpha/beta hydrolase n=1 Tax=Actinophytocola sp. TaxID=1872138 RepID=UPI0039C89AD3